MFLKELLTRSVSRLPKRCFSTRPRPALTKSPFGMARNARFLIASNSNLPFLDSKFSSKNVPETDMLGMALLDLAVYEQICSDTLEDLCEYFEEIVEKSSNLETTPDVVYSDGVLTVKLSDKHGTYVINRQTPNRQIWLSSPTSGPKRYDFVPNDNSKLPPGRIAKGKWIYKHDSQSLHHLLQNEIQPILSDLKVDFIALPSSGYSD